jgi:CBS domain-containing protein
VRATRDALLSLTASDLMTRALILIPERMPLRDAARLLSQNQISGAPVVDRSGRCVGVLSATDLIPLARKPLAGPPAIELPITCSFQRPSELADGTAVIACTLPAGACPLQRLDQDRDDNPVPVCREPRCVLADSQIVQVEKQPTDDARTHMTADPVVTAPNTSIRVLARHMIDAHIHRIVVVDDERRPIGIVSSTDILAAVAYAEDE